MSLPGESADPQQYESKGKTREEYLIRREDQLLSVLRDLYKSVNRGVALSYGIATIVLLVCWQRVKQVSLPGVELPLDVPEVSNLAPIALFLTTVFTDYALVRISSVLGEIKSNTDELLSLNLEAKPVTIYDMYLFGAGITGLILALARWPLHRLRLKNKSGLPSRGKLFEPFAHTRLWEALFSVYKLCQWAAVILVGSATVLGVLCLPFFLVYNLVVKGLPAAAGQPPVRPAALSTAATVYIVVTLGLSALSVVICGLRLFAYYSIEYIQAFGRDFTDLVSRYVSILRNLRNLADQ
jgi:hypothetical protein